MRNLFHRIFSGSSRHAFTTMLAGAAFWLIGEVIYSRAVSNWFTPLAIAAWFLAFAAVIAVVLWNLSRYNANFSDPSISSIRRSRLRLGVMLLAVIFLLAGLLEFLYELGRSAMPPPSSYVFLIDDSSSMSGTEQDRADAINDIMSASDADIPYAVYQFTTEASLIKPMGRYHAGDAQQIQFASSGGTDILGSLDAVLSDLSAGRLSQAGANPRVLVLSDGESLSLGLKGICQKAVDQGVSVSSVGMRGSAGLLKRIAARTGGVYVPCGSASALAGTMQKAITSSAERNLLSERFVLRHDLLYGILRVLFLSLLGVVWSFFKGCFTWEKRGSADRAACFPTGSVPCCALGAVALELLANLGLFPIRFLRLAFCVLWALTPGSSDRWERRRYQAPETPIPSPAGDSDDAAGADDETNKRLLDQTNPDSSLLKTIQDTGDFPNAGGVLSADNTFRPSGGADWTGGSGWSGFGS